MELITRKFHAERIVQNKPQTVQVEVHADGTMSVDLENMSRFGTKLECAQYLDWAADQVAKLPFNAEEF